MELRQLSYFITVADLRSYTRAAARLHVSQSTLSVAIRNLEGELGARLLERTTHQVGLTEAGSAFLVEARLTLAAAERARQAVAGVQETSRGALDVGIMQSLLLVDIAGLLTSYHWAHPGVTLRPRTAEGGSASLASWVADGGLDVALAVDTGDYRPGVRSEVIAREPLVLACPSSHRLARRRRLRLQEVAGEPFVETPPGWGIRALADRLFTDIGVTREVALEVPDVATVVELVKAGLGVSLLTRSLVPQTEGLSLIHVTPMATFAVAMLTPSARPQSLIATAFAQSVRERHQALLAPRRNSPQPHARA